MALGPLETFQAKVTAGFPWGTKAPNNRNVATCLLDFSKSNNWVIDATWIQGQIDQFPILGLFVDNSNNPNPLSFNCGPPIGQTFDIPAGACARLPIEAGTPVKLDVTAVETFGGTVEVILLNYAPSPIVWYPDTPNSLSQPATYFPLGYVQHTVNHTDDYVLAPPDGAIAALVTIEAQGVRWTDDGTAPTATRGMPVGATENIIFNENLSNIHFCGQADGAILNISYYKY